MPGSPVIDARRDPDAALRLRAQVDTRDRAVLQSRQVGGGDAIRSRWWLRRC
jgi:hypothetical protein